MAERGRCWRMIYNSTIQGTDCPERVAWRGRFSNGGKSWGVWACDGHTDELEELRAVR
jgi:hypothetical protein